MSAGGDAEPRPWWREDLVVIVGMCATILVAWQFADGTSRPEIMLGTALVLGLLLRVSRRGWHRARHGREHRS